MLTRYSQRAVSSNLYTCYTAEMSQKEVEVGASVDVPDYKVGIPGAGHDDVLVCDSHSHTGHLVCVPHQNLLHDTPIKIGTH